IPRFGGARACKGLRRLVSICVSGSWRRCGWQPGFLSPAQAALCSDVLREAAAVPGWHLNRALCPDVCRDPSNTNPRFVEPALVVDKAGFDPPIFADPGRQAGHERCGVPVTNSAELLSPISNLKKSHSAMPTALIGFSRAR